MMLEIDSPPFFIWHGEMIFLHRRLSRSKNLSLIVVLKIGGL